MAIMQLNPDGNPLLTRAEEEQRLGVGVGCGYVWDHLSFCFLSGRRGDGNQTHRGGNVTTSLTGDLAATYSR